MSQYPIRRFEYAKCVKVIDGDTIDIEIDLGFSVKIKQRFRLARINTPERGKEGWTAATNYMLDNVFLNPVVIRSEKLDKYGRFLAELWVGDLNINDEMLRLGLAKEYV